MKKFFNVINFILIGMLLFTVSCGKNQKLSKEEVIENFVKNSIDIKSFNTSSRISLYSSKAPEDIKTIDFLSETSITLEPFVMKIKMEIPRLNQGIEIYLKDGYRYTLTPAKEWFKVQDDEFKEYLKKYMAENNEIYDVFKNNIDKIDLKEEDDYYLITISEYWDFYRDIVKKQMEKLTLLSRDIDIKDIFVEYKVDKKTFFPISSYTSANMIVDGVELDLKIDMEYRDINKVNNIDLPKEAQEAEERR